MAVISYGDKNYQQKKNLFDVLSQVFEEYKYGATHGNHSWNMPVQELRGCTVRFKGEGLLELTYHRYVTGTVETIARIDNEGEKFLREVEKALKKEFKEKTGKQLKLSKVHNQDRYVEKTSRISGESSWMLNSNRHGYGARPVGKFLVRDTNVYEFDANL